MSELNKLMLPNEKRNTMANSCYNLLEIWGNDQVTQQVKAWNTALDTVDVPSDDVHRMGTIRKVFYPSTPDAQALDLGSKWAGNRPLEPRTLEVEFFPMEEVLHEKVKIH